MVAVLVSLLATTNVVVAQHSLRVVFIDGTEAAALWEGRADAQGVSLVYASRSTTVNWRGARHRAGRPDTHLRRDPMG